MTATNRTLPEIESLLQQVGLDVAESLVLAVRSGDPRSHDLARVAQCLTSAKDIIAGTRQCYGDRAFREVGQ